MKDNNRNQKYALKKNIVLSKKEIKTVSHIMDFKKPNKSYIYNNMKKNQIIKKPSPNKLEPIKVRLTPINKRYSSKGKNITIKDTSINSNNNNNNNNYNNSVYLSPAHITNYENRSLTHHKLDKKITFTENRKDLKDENINKNCSTPYRRILNTKSKEAISPSTSVIIKNFNYNNVYNINIDNEKKKNKNNIKLNNKTISKNENNNDNNIDNNMDNNNNNSCKNILSRKFTYNKPKTTSNMNISCALSKRNRSKEICLMNDNNKNDDKNNTINKSETVFSKFITEGNNLKNNRNNINLPVSNLITTGKKLEKQRSIETPNRYKIKGRFNMTTKNSNNNDFNLTSQTINNNTYSNHFINNDLYTNTNFNKTGINYFYNCPNISLSNNYIHRNINDSQNKYNRKTKSIIIDDNYNINNNENKEIIFDLNDLFIFEDRINDILSAFNKNNNIYDIEASNECNEFINFYSKSSLRGIFPTFFKENNKLIIESSINLSLLFISIIYNLSTNNFLFNDIISTINNILSYLKINFALYIKKIQLYYGENVISKNYTYFQPFNNFLNNNNIKDIDEEDDITYKIYQNCKIMTNEIKIIMKYYEKIDMSFYNFYIKIFNNISIQKENELLNSLFGNIATKINNSFNNIITVNKTNNNINNININNSVKNNNDYSNPKLIKNKTNMPFGYFSPYKKEKISFKTPEKIYLKSPMRATKSEIKNKIEIPYIKTPSNKKYTLVLDLNKTLALYNERNISLRSGLFSFLSMIKSYYELISFSCEPNDISENILKEIESHKKYFDYNFTRQHSILYDNTLVKDISLIGRDISKIIIVDDDENCFKLNKENGIKIGVYNGNSNNDNVLFELKKILILIYKKNYEDVRIAIKEFSNDIMNKVSLV